MQPDKIGHYNPEFRIEVYYFVKSNVAFEKPFSNNGLLKIIIHQLTKLEQNR